MKKVIAALLVMGLLVGAGSVYAQQPTTAIVFDKMSDTVVSLFDKANERQAYDNQRAFSSIELPAVCDASGRYTVHYWRSDNGSGAMYLDGCINSDVSKEVATILGSLDMKSVPKSLLVTGQSGTDYTIHLFCTGENQRAIIDNNDARCTTE